tara:strand:- start:2951 stop:3397 length:447 start_codon:yes stop_codon:yes gene_type:complete
MYADDSQLEFGEDVIMNYYSEGLLEFKLVAPFIEKFSDPNLVSVFKEGVDVFIYNNSLDTIASISSDFAIHHESDKLIEIKRSIVLTNDKDEKLTTETLFWNRIDKEIYTDDFVTINREKEIIMGYGFRSDESFSTYSLSNITGTIYL